MIIRNHVIAPRRGNKLQAQGNALGKEKRSQRPERAKALTHKITVSYVIYFKVLKNK